MSTAAQQNPDQNKPEPKRMTVIPRDSVTSTQINTLMQVLGNLSVVLLNPTRDGAEGRPELDGGVVAAAEAAFIKCCTVIEDVLAEKSRWTIDMQNILEFQLGQAYDSQTEFYRSQTAMANLAQAPSTRYRPTLVPTSDGSGYIAFIGSINDLANSIYGVGDSPAAAMRAFDEVFAGRMPDSMVQWLAEREAAIEAGKTPPEFPHKVVTQQNENEKLDGRASRAAKKTPKRRKNSSGNRGPDGGPVDQGS